MKIAPIISQLQQTLPFFTDIFSDSLEITSIGAFGGTATATTLLPHGLTTGGSVIITNAVQTAVIVTFVVAGGKGVIRAASDHGMIMNFDFKTLDSTTILRLRNSANTALNGDYAVLSVPNRYNVTFKTNLADGTYPTDGLILDYAFTPINGTQQVTGTPTLNSFTFAVPDSIITQTAMPSTLTMSVRVSGAATLERAVASYTDNERTGKTNKFWAFVTHGNTTTNKNRNMLNDSTVTLTTADEYQYFVIEDVDVNVFAPTANDLSGRVTRDKMEDVKLALMRCMLGLPTYNQYSINDQLLFSFVSDFAIEYERPVLAHGFKFQAMYRITEGDTNQLRKRVPFRNLDLNTTVNTQTLINMLNLDSNPNF